MRGLILAVLVLLVGCGQSYEVAKEQYRLERIELDRVKKERQVVVDERAEQMAKCDLLHQLILSKLSVPGGTIEPGELEEVTQLRAKFEAKYKEPLAEQDRFLAEQQAKVDAAKKLVERLKPPDKKR